jgi:hypothetical protein
MGLKNLASIYDLVQGVNQPVEDMAGQTGPPFDYGPGSNMHGDPSQLPNPSELTTAYYSPQGWVGWTNTGNVPIGPVPVNSQYQDLDGAPGPSFDYGPGSTMHSHPSQLLSAPPSPTELTVAYNSPQGWVGWQNLGPTAIGPVDQDLGGLPGPQFDLGTPSQVHGDPGRKPFPTELVTAYMSPQGWDGWTNLGLTAIGPVTQDLDGLNGPQFDTGAPSQVHADPTQGTPTELVTAYNSPQGWVGFTNLGPTAIGPVTQDLDGLQGPQSQLPTALASQVHINSLLQVPGPPSNSPYQDLDGQIDPLYFTDAGTAGSPFDSPFNTTDDHHTELLQGNNVFSANSQQTYDPSLFTSPYQDLNGIQGPSFDYGVSSTMHGDSISPNPTELAVAYMSPQGWNGWTNTGNVPIGPVPVNSSYQDINMTHGPTTQPLPFDLGAPSQVHADPGQSTPTELVSAYTSQINPTLNYGNGSTWPVVGPVPVNSSFQDLDGLDGPSFDYGYNSTMHGDDISPSPSELATAYNSPINPMANHGNGSNWPIVGPVDLDIDMTHGLGTQPTQFDTGDPSQVHADPGQLTPTGLVAAYNSPINPLADYGNGPNQWPQVGPVPVNSQFQDLNGLEGPIFTGGTPLPNSNVTLHTSLLTQDYISTINPLSTYAAGQPGATWPTVAFSPISPTHFQDLDGGLPSNGEYLNNLPT